MVLGEVRSVCANIRLKFDRIIEEGRVNLSVNDFEESRVRQGKVPVAQCSTNNQIRKCPTPGETRVTVSNTH